MIVPLAREHVRPAARVLARAFDASPAYVSLWPDARRRARAVEAFMAIPLTDGLRHGFGEVLIDDESVAGAAVWYPPGGFPLGAAREARVLRQILAAAQAAPRTLPRLARFGSNLANAFPGDRPWYLAVVGVEPQGRGLGSRLLTSGLERVDGDCYLETDTAEAARLYGRLGFETLEAGVQLLPSGPTHWRMRRH